MDAQHINNSDMTFQDRWRCLQSVDDLVERLVQTLEAKDELDNTYIVYTGDHGQHLGEWGMGFDKRNLYETDIRVPLLVRGPGVAAGQNLTGMASHVDLAVTFIDMFGAKKPPLMDGTSWLPLISGKEEQRREVEKAWRHDLLIEYGGPSVPAAAARDLRGARAFAAASAAEEKAVFRGGGGGGTAGTCGVPVAGHDIHVNCSGITRCGGEHGNCPCDASNNTYKCVRTINATENSIYCEFDDSVSFVEYYDVGADPYELHNIATSSEAATEPVTAKMAALSRRLRNYMHCWGDDCFDPSGDPPPIPQPPPPPPGPPPKGAHVYKKGGMCLGCQGFGCADLYQHVPLTMQPCPAAGTTAQQVWLETVSPGPKREPNLQSSFLGGGCINLENGAQGCTITPHTKSKVHIYECDSKQDEGHVGDHFVWNTTHSALQATFCGPELAGGPMCISADGSAGQVYVGPCGAAGASGWTRETT